MDLSNFCYHPILKTKDAELRAISNLDFNSASKTLPIFELTKSRITKKDSVGDIAKRVSQIREIQRDRPFILDVTTDTNQVNDQTKILLTPENGYECWRQFLNAHHDLSLIPVIHIDFELDPELEETKKFVQLASRNHSILAARIPPGLDEHEYKEIFDAISPSLGLTKLYVLLDAGCIRKKFKATGNLDEIKSTFSSSIRSIFKLSTNRSWLLQLVSISGSFPPVVSVEGGDESGRFSILEHRVNLSLRQAFPLIKLGDYGSINAQQTEMRGGTFVPRIDFCNDENFFYHRFRRDKGAYIKCAQEVLKNPHYSSLGTWGDEEIMAAANGKPSGISPSFWISVRANRYMSSRVKLYQN